MLYLRYLGFLASWGQLGRLQHTTYAVRALYGHCTGTGTSPGGPPEPWSLAPVAPRVTSPHCSYPACSMMRPTKSPSALSGCSGFRGSRRWHEFGGGRRVRARGQDLLAVVNAYLHSFSLFLLIKVATRLFPFDTPSLSPFKLTRPLAFSTAHCLSTVHRRQFVGPCSSFARRRTIGTWR